MKTLLARLTALLMVASMAAVMAFTQTPHDPLQATAQALFQPLPNVMLDPERAFSQELVDLSKMLYYDPRLSLSGFVSCNSCHNLATYGVDNLPTSLGHRWAVGPRNAGPALGGDIIARFGIVESYWEATREFVTIDSPTMTMDVGVYAVTQNRADLYVFKTPSLRNITRTYPYFHDGSGWDLADATQIMARVQLGREIPETDLVALMAFYQTLEGEIPAYALQLPVLPASSRTTPRPRNN